MTDRSITRRRARLSPARTRAPGAAESLASDAIVEAFAGRGRECAFANIRLLGRIVANFYDVALSPPTCGRANSR